MNLIKEDRVVKIEIPCYSWDDLTDSGKLSVIRKMIGLWYRANRDLGPKDATAEYYLSGKYAKDLNDYLVDAVNKTYLIKGDQDRLSTTMCITLGGVMEIEMEWVK